MMRSLSCLLAVGTLAGCTHTPTSPHEQCHVESGWLDSTNGCSARAGYPDCYKVCADGTREHVGASPPPSAPPPPATAPPH
jgi:hypothetical protein